MICIHKYLLNRATAADTLVIMKVTYIVPMAGKMKILEMIQTDVRYQTVKLNVIMVCAQVQIIVPAKLDGKYYKFFYMLFSNIIN